MQLKWKLSISACLSCTHLSSSLCWSSFFPPQPIADILAHWQLPDFWIIQETKLIVQVIYRWWNRSGRRRPSCSCFVSGTSYNSSGHWEAAESFWVTTRQYSWWSQKMSQECFKIKGPKVLEYWHCREYLQPESLIEQRWRLFFPFGSPTFYNYFGGICFSLITWNSAAYNTRRWVSACHNRNT